MNEFQKAREEFDKESSTKILRHIRLAAGSANSAEPTCTNPERSGSTTYPAADSAFLEYQRQYLGQIEKGVVQQNRAHRQLWPVACGNNCRGIDYIMLG